MRVLVTRPQPGAAITAERLHALGHQALLSPVSILRPIAAFPPAAPVDAVVVSSANALRVLQPAVLESIRLLPVFTVGVATARMAQTLGLDAISGPGTAEQLPATIARRFASPARLLYLAGEPRKPVLEQSLAASGYTLIVHLCYRMESATSLTSAARAALEDGAVDAVLHFSQESAKRFSTLVVAAGCADAARPIRHICMSADVVAGLKALNPGITQCAERPTEEALLRLLDKGD